FRARALVITVSRPPDLSGPEFSFDLYTAYDFDLKTRQPTFLWNGHKMNILSDEPFETSPIPDIVFTYDRCVECEPSTHLSAFHYNKAWEVRSWGNKRAPGVVIDITGMEENWTITFIYAIDAFESHKLKQIAVWWRERNSKTREIKEAVELY